MAQKKTLFAYLHDALVLQMTSGKLAYGDTLPSTCALCDLYNVGIRTVRDVMTRLAEEGYVETQERSRARVVYRGSHDDGYAQQARDLLSRCDAVLALSSMQECIMPHVYAEASKLVDGALIDACRADLAGIDALSTKDQWRKASAMLQRITSIYGNDLLQDLVIDFDLFGQVPALPGFRNPYEEMSQNAEAGLNAFLDRIAYQDYNGVSATIARIFRNATESVEQYYGELEAAYPQVLPESVTFEWDAEKGRIHTYMEVARSIIQKIGDGIYPDNTYLPGSTQIKEEYGVSAYTVSNVLQVLEDTGLVEKKKKRGGYLITFGGARAKDLFIDGSTQRADAITFLSAVHIVALISKGIALLGYDYLDDEKIDRMEQEVELEETLTLPNGLLAILVEAQPNASLKTVYRELEKLMMWGYYFAFARNDPSRLRIIREKSRIAIGYARSGEKAAFADMIQNVYYYVFQIMQEALLGFGVADVIRLKLP